MNLDSSESASKEVCAVRSRKGNLETKVLDLKKEGGSVAVGRLKEVSSSFSRRSFLKACGVGVLAGASLGLVSCSSGNALLSLYESRLEDKHVRPEADTSALNDEPKVSIRFLASTGMSMVLPALQDAYVKEHANVEFADPVFVDSSEVLENLSSETYDGYITDLASTSLEAVKSGLVLENERTALFSGKVVVVGSSDVYEAVEAGADVKTLEIESLVLGNVDTVFSGAYANQALNSADLYSKATGRDGTYSDSLANKVTVADSIEAMGELINAGQNTVGLMMKNEAFVLGFDCLYEIPRIKYKTVSYTAAPLVGSAQHMQAFDFITFCDTETEAEKVADTFGMPLE
jgi:ABC-type molybdate transport system substrate-binding protein